MHFDAFLTARIDASRYSSWALHRRKSWFLAAGWGRFAGWIAAYSSVAVKMSYSPSEAFCGPRFQDLVVR